MSTVGLPSLTLIGPVPFESPKLYKSIIMALQYVNQYLHSPLDKHWHAIKRILSYLTGTIDHGLAHKPAGHSLITGLSDVDWGSTVKIDNQPRAIVHIFGGNLIASSSNVLSKSIT
ncbi:hypothetical protein V6Z11_A04G131400 [Gossypium hirsutum]